ncbi:MAG TPA: FeoA domain-containing protein [Bryobacteraceae bacterium]|jgi:ferrous iron transport protein A|nr:FeoA domain-containing protein [Bryobacteraceae bacterium]
MQLSFNSGRSRRRAPARRAAGPKTLLELEPGRAAVLERLEVPEEVATRLMELGFLPGHVIVPGLSAPGGDPRVFQVDGSEVALRRETAARLFIRPLPEL